MLRMDEDKLIQAIKDGEQESFRNLVLAYQDKVLNSAYGFVHNREDAEDIAQEVFIEIYESLDTFRGDAKLSTWIYRITVTKCLDHLRRKKRKKRAAPVKELRDMSSQEEGSASADGSNPQDELETRQRVEILQHAIEKLPQNQRIALNLSRFNEMSYKEIADVMNISLSSVESLIFRAKDNLKKKLIRYYLKQF